METLMRSRTNRRIAGICGGLAESQGWNVLLIRLLWLATVLFAGTGVLLYLILWLVLPEQPLVLPPHTGYAPVYPSTQPHYPAGGTQAVSPPGGGPATQA